MAVQGEKREKQVVDSVKKVGLFEANVIAINPTVEEYKELLGIELQEDSKATEYLGKSKDDNTYLRLDVWMEEVKSKDKFKVTFFLEDKERENKDGTKKQFINNVGACSWAADENDLPDWFKKRDYRAAHAGEEEMYNFLRTWLSGIDYVKDSAVLEIEWKKLMKGNVKELKEQINGEWCGNVVALATITTKEKDGEVKEYQTIYNRAFLPPYYLKNFRLVNYSDPSVLAGLRAKKSKDLKPYERFALNVTGEYGCRDYYTLRDLQEYNPDDNLVASDKPITEDGDDY